MLVYWLQKVVGIDTGGQSRVFNMTGGGRGRERWEKHKQFTLVSLSAAGGQHAGDDGDEDDQPASDRVRTIRSNHLSNNIVHVVEEDVSEENSREKMKISKAWVFHDDIFIIKSQDKTLYTSVEGVYYRSYDTQSLLGSEVTCVNVFLNILCLGLSSGSLHLHHLSDPVDVLRLDLAQPLHRVQVCQGPVIDVTMAVVQDTFSFLTLMCVTNTGNVVKVIWKSSLPRLLDERSTDRFVVINNNIHIFISSLPNPFRSYTDSMGQALD